MEELSKEKVFQVADIVSGEEETVVIGADTIVSFQGKILGKPSDKEDSGKMLEMLQGKTHQVYTGVTIALFREGRWQRDVYKRQASGVSDLMGKYICLADWKIANLLTGEYYCEYLAEMEEKALKAVKGSIRAIESGEEEACELSLIHIFAD